MKKIELTRENLIMIANKVYNSPSRERRTIVKQYGISYATLYRKLKEIGYERNVVIK